MKRRSLLLAAPLGWSLANIALAQSAYPSKTIRYIVPVSAGGGSDMVGRTVCERLGRVLGQTIVVDNLGGGGGVIASQTTARAPADGYTLMQGYVATHGTAPATRKLPYDAIKDFTPIGMIGSTPNVLCVNAAMPIQDVKSFLDFVRKNPGKVSYGSAGAGSLTHLTAELFKLQTGAFMVHIPYRGGAAAQTDIMAGNIEASFQNFGTVVPYIRAGKMKALAVTSKNRMPQLPQVPTMIESGLADFDVTSWQAFAAPKGTPKDIIAKLHADMAKGLRSADVTQRFNAQGFDIVANTPAEASAFFKQEIDRWTAVVKQSGATVD